MLRCQTPVLPPAHHILYKGGLLHPGWPRPTSAPVPVKRLRIVMSCPFAKFATKLPFNSGAGQGLTYHHHHTLAQASSAMPLSEALRVGTARSHRLVEKSKGVALILQASGNHASPSIDFPGLHFDRTDYVQWNIMLACIYVALEAALYVLRSHPLLHPLFEDNDLVIRLSRTTALQHDIEAHLAVLYEHTGASLSDLAEHARDTRQHITSADVSDFDDSAEARAELQTVTQRHAAAALPAGCHTSASSGTSSSNSPYLTSDHFDLLTSAQTQATLRYVRHLTLLTQSPHSTANAFSDRAGLLLAHAYTRYLGDLSGGQHIYRKVSKNFPVSSSSAKRAGFEFYHFESASDHVDPCQDLKRRFRLAMETGFSAYCMGTHSAQASQNLVDEANIAFDLNTELFESLLPVELRMSNVEVAASLDQPAPVVVVAPAVSLKSRSNPTVSFPGGTFLAAVTIAAMLYLTSSSVAHFTHLFF